jgi:two-component system LytT family sensor kinase
VKLFWKYKLDHVLFWFVTILFHCFLKNFLWVKAGAFQFFLEVFLRNGLLAGICYINIGYFFPRYFKKGSYGIYILSAILCLAIYTVLKNLHDTWLYGYLMGDFSKRNFFYNTYYNFSTALFYVAFTLALELSKKWYAQQQLLQKIQVEKLNTELQYLKAQMNPHFLFNSLNSIHFQIDKTNKEARESLQKFSSMLRYQLYECNAETVPVEKEIVYLQYYVDMQRLRKNNQYQIKFDASGSIKNFNIAPLLLLPFIENAFKHLSAHTDKPNYINIQMDKQDEVFYFTISNTKDITAPVYEEGGIGLKNVERRLELLYNGNHELNIENTAETFSVMLKIKLP